MIRRRRSRLTASLGLDPRIFASRAERDLAAAIEAGLAQVEKELLEAVRFAHPVADAAARYLLEAGGKRVRPVLTLLVAQLGRGIAPEVLKAAQAIELTHLGSLYHDDVMDDSARRRGVPAAQLVWGNSVAILTGDLLFARASHLMADISPRAIRLQAATFERLVLGQLEETVGPQPDTDPVAHYLEVLANKTGSLIGAATQAGALFSEADPAFEDPLVAYGERLGVAFQLADDVLDLSPSADATGKVPGTDLRSGVETLPLLRLRECAERDVESAALLARIEREVLPDREGAADPAAPTTRPITRDADDILRQLREHPATAATLAEAHRWAEDAVAALAPLPEGIVKRALCGFAATVVTREG